MNRRHLKILGLASIIVLGLVIAAAAGGGAVYALTQNQAGATQPAYQPPAERGLVIVSVEPGSPADQAGVKRGDILLSLNDHPTDTRGQLVSMLNTLAVGSQVQLTVLHGDDRRTLTVTIGKRNGRPYLGLIPCGGTAPVFPGSQFAAGARIIDVIPNSPADQAGLNPGDLILAVNGQEIDAGHPLNELIAAYAPGNTVTLTVQSPGRAAREVTVTLNEHPDQPGAAYLGVQFILDPVGRLFRDDNFPVPPPFRPDNVQQGIFIRRVLENSPAAQAGLQPRDVITAIDGQPVARPFDLRDAVAQRQPGDALTLTVIHPGQEQATDITVTLAEDPNRSGQAYLGVEYGGFIRYRHSPPASDETHPWRRWFDFPPFNFMFKYLPAPNPDEFPNFEEFEFEWCGGNGCDAGSI